MNATRNPEAILAAWLDEGPTDLPDATRRAILTSLPTTPQARRGPFAPWRFSLMNTYTRVAAAAIVAVIAIGGALYLIGPRSGVGGPSATITPPTPSPSAGPVAYASSQFAFPIGLVLIDNWAITTDEPGVIGFHRPNMDAIVMNLATMTVRGPAPADPWVPWPADAYAWFAGRAEFHPVATRTTVIGGRSAVVIDVDTVPAGITNNGDWVKYGTGASDGMNLRGPSPERMHIVIVMTGATSGIVAQMGASTADFDASVTAFDALLATLTFR